MGIGPGSRDHLTRRAEEVLSGVDVVVGYRPYLELIEPLLAGCERISSGMTAEVQRAHAAVERARAGKACAVVSSGDPGIYAMAGLVLETCQAGGIPVVSPGSDPPARPGRVPLTLEVVPGVPALCAGAALLGAPLTHDFAVISLSDLLTPWEVIARRLRAAAEADFVTVLYNPKSKKRTWQLEKAQQILLAHRDSRTPVGVVRRAMRAGQEVQIVALKDLHTARVDMETTVFVGSRTSSLYADFMITPRGYAQKYGLHRKEGP